MPTTRAAGNDFAGQALRILGLPVEARINELGGYGPEGEVIYERHPRGSPSVLVDSQDCATATFMTNGSTAFTVKIPEGLEVRVLDGCFDPVEKREAGVPSTNAWLELAAGRRRLTASLLNPRANLGCEPESVRVVKVGDPDRAMWYCARFRAGAGLTWATVLRHSLVLTSAGPALLRQVLVLNTGRRPLGGRLWSYYGLHGTQRFVYNKELWYDRGLPLSGTETVVAASVPYSRILQIKRLASRLRGLVPAEATCDYSDFTGDTAALAALPEAVRRGRLVGTGAGRQLNRFATATIAANSFRMSLAPGRAAFLEQSLLYVTDERVQERFRRLDGSPEPTYRAVSRAFTRAARAVVQGTPGVAAAVSAGSRRATASAWPVFEFSTPGQRAVSEYAKSVWTGVRELYENCRAHGAKMAEGIELGTRDRAQDMWPKMKEDPARVRSDLVHAFGFMYVTQPKGFRPRGRLTLEQKLHGMFPRQFPSRWDDRTKEVRNDNRPYADSPLWLVDSLCRYLRETGDASILGERVTTVRLTDVSHPERSGLLGAERRQTVLEAALEIFWCFERHAADTPYGMAQVLYGDWCDPIDMFGTSRVGDATGRGKGRGVCTRLSCHLFDCVVAFADLLAVPGTTGAAARAALPRLRAFADRLRRDVVKWAWESGEMAGFLECIHELRADGSRPTYRRGGAGYTLGSMRGRDFDGVRRRLLHSQAYGLRMLMTDRPWLRPVSGRDAMVAELLRTVDRLFFRPDLGLLLFSSSVANTPRTIDLVGRIGVLPMGTAENGEYHHGQVMMHLFRLALPGQADTVWKQFRMVMSAMRGEDICGPFDMPATSYVAADGDPHFGKAMYFGLSGSTDWIVQIFEAVAGLETNLHDPRLPAVRVTPQLPAELCGELRLRRILHPAAGPGRFRAVPLEILVRRRRTAAVRINGRRAERAEVASLAGLKRLVIEVDLPGGR